MLITLTFADATSLRVQAGTTLQQVEAMLPEMQYRPLAALVNNSLQEMDYPLLTDSQISWLDVAMPEGWRIYQRSSIFLMQAAAKKLFPGRELWVSHLETNGYYCWLRDEQGLNASAADINKLEQAMRELVQQQLPISRREIARADAAAFFRKQNNEGKASLIDRRQENYASLYTLGDMTDYLFGRMVINTCYIEDFSLLPYEFGFLLCLPTRSFVGCPESANKEEHVQAGMVNASVADYTEWSELMNVRTASDLNLMVEAGSREFLDFTLAAEALQDRFLHGISDKIYADFPTARLILIAGPSSAGKTTTTRRLAIQFRTLGIRSLVISLDDYFFDRDKTPLTAEGKPDLESISAVDTASFTRDMLDLLAGKEVALPRYDFVLGKSIPNHRSIRLAENQILLVEGIHALNSALTKDIPPQNKRGIFISTMNQVNLDNCTPFSTSDNRLLRRMVRDCQFRGYNAEQTLLHWGDVRLGEQKYIFPWAKNADFFINSSLLYEIPVLRPLAEPALREIGSDSPCYLDAQRLLKLIGYFAPADSEVVPSTSLLREFIGNGLLGD